MNISKLIISLIMASALTACGATAGKYRPIVDGAANPDYEIDLASCQSLSENKSYANDDVKSEAAMGAVLGTVAGAIEDGTEGALGGAIVGGAISGGGRAWETRDERKNIVIECMKQRGHKVIG